MTQQDKDILLKDLCARVPYRTIVHITDACDYEGELEPFDTRLSFGVLDNFRGHAHTIKPYLRPMSSMTEEEKQKYYDLTHQEDDDVWAKCLFDKMVDFCNERHLDYRGLIPMGLALEAPEGMYKTE